MLTSKATMLILFALFLSGILLESIPRAEAQLIVPCKTSEQCKSIRCSNGSAQCVNKQCQCPSLKQINSMMTVSCKTVSDCAASHQCPPGLYACVEGKCICLP
ncbi:hypothetical protein ARALYDRAFT_320322 [Arabidopsis lyrata subsp. lyrata]|uniref:Uncharacterized protein n=1 Tax=Arabidopsis lyrata subsp. lyrata TaxID=81972 RepID=D7LK60_ARALL|nr:putative defensin-like protein 298 [Arabidopsis lyrata subsp. lyrata]EFH55090.1 hypothetical protein ARALYDRAFT_320322 [Arabidopsis lyrata subsp. lyrata]|eukprot:XP_002878831.1 putative defensin-like protein 298 [Arabidopsis lyrata subsp. lyrata]